MTKPAFHATWLFLAAAFFIQQAKYACPPAGSRIAGLSELLTTVPSVSAVKQTSITGGGGGAILVSGSDANIGWHVVPNSAMQPNGPGGLGDECPPNGSFAFDDQCKQLIWAWGTGMYASKSRQFCLLGGGHTDYAGNEVYCVDLSRLPVIIRRTAAPTTPFGSCVLSNGGKISARHPYDGVDYIPTSDELIYAGGPVFGGTCFEANDSWTLPMSSIPTTVGSCGITRNCNPVWTTRGNISPGCNLDGKMLAYDPNRDLVFLDDRCNFYSYDRNTSAWTNLHGSINNHGHSTAVIDPVNKLFVVMGSQGDFYSTSIAVGSTYTMTGHSDSSCSSLFNQDWPGIDYDKVNQRIVGIIPGNGNLVVLNTNTWTCTTETYSNPPTVPSANGAGTFGKFRYMEAENAFGYYPDYNQNFWFIRRQAAPQELPFAARCLAFGVTTCQSLDQASQLNIVGSNGLFPGNQTTATLDPAVHPNDGSTASLKFVVPISGDQNSSGNWTHDFGAQFDTGQVFYLQFRMRSNDGFAQNYNAAGEKHFIIWHNSGGPSCTDVQFVMLNENYGGYPRLYQNCSPDLLANFADGDFGLEFGAYSPPSDPTAGNGGYLCTYRKDGPGENNCATYPANNWQTYYYKVTPGNWGSSNTRIEAWVANEGQNMRKFFDKPDCNFTRDNANKKWGRIDLTPYDTGRTATVANPMSVWYSGLIVSSQPIASPTGPTP